VRAGTTNQTSKWQIVSDVSGDGPRAYQTERLDFPKRGLQLSLWEVFAREEANKDIDPPGVFSPFKWLGKGTTEVNNLRPQARRTLYATTVLKPLASETIERLLEVTKAHKSDPQSVWRDQQAVDALAELLRIYAAGDQLLPKDPQGLKLDRLFNYTLKQKDGKPGTGPGGPPLADLQATHDALYPITETGPAWFSAAFADATPKAIEARKAQLETIVDSFCAYASLLGQGTLGEARQLDDLRKALVEFDDCERNLFKLREDTSPLANLDDAARRVTKWSEAYKALKTADGTLVDRIKAVEDFDNGLHERLANAQAKARNDSAELCDELGKCFKSDSNDSIARKLRDAKPATTAPAPDTALATLSREHLDRAAGQQRPFLRRLVWYDTVDAIVQKASAASTGSRRTEIDLATALKSRQWERWPEDCRKVRDDLPREQDLPRLPDVVKLCDEYILSRVYMPAYRNHEIATVLREMSGVNIGALVGAVPFARTGAAKMYDRKRLELSLAAPIDFRPEFYPDSADMLMDAIDALLTSPNPEAAGSPAVFNRDDLLRSSDAERLRSARDLYRNAFKEYWLNTVAEEARPTAESWSKLRDALNDNVAKNVPRLNQTLVDLHTARLQALECVAADANDMSSARQAIQGQIDMLDGRITQICDRVVKKWGALPRDAAEARTAILESTKGDFLDYLLVSINGTVDTSVYWNQIGLLALGRISAERGAAGRQAMDSLNALKEKFPLKANGATTMNQPDIDAFQKALREAKLAMRREGAETIGGGARTNSTEVNDALNELQGKLTEPQQALVRRMDILAQRFGILRTATSNPPAPARCTLLLVKDPDQRKLADRRHLVVNDRWANLSVKGKNAHPDAPRFVGTADDAKLAVIEFGNGARNELTLEFSDPQGGVAPGKIVFDDPWDALFHLKSRVSVPGIDTEGGAGDVVLAEYKVDGEYNIWLKIQFTEPMPRIGADGQWDPGSLNAPASAPFGG
jgi:hypothetical protein